MRTLTELRLRNYKCHISCHEMIGQIFQENSIDVLSWKKTSVHSGNAAVEFKLVERC